MPKKKTAPKKEKSFEETPWDSPNNLQLLFQDLYILRLPPAIEAPTMGDIVKRLRF